MSKIEIQTSSKQYPVWVGFDILSTLPKQIELLGTVSSILVIVDESVQGLHLPTLLNVLPKENHVYVVPNGEGCKTFSVYEEVLTFALEKRLDRKSLVIAFGGGAVGDLAGFVASTYMRGIPFIQVPTTLLAHDSAVGGKVAINHKLGKNMIGQFHQPEAVVYDLNFLKTLPKEEWLSGFGEVIKHSMLDEHHFYEELKDECRSISDLQSSKMKEFIKKGIHVKNRIVTRDERETSVRAFLNFGHTFGHSLEKEVGYGKIRHGEAVVTGILFALYLSKKHLNLSFDLDELFQWMKKLGYSFELADLEFDALYHHMLGDKKTINGEITFVLLKQIGEPVLLKLSKSNLTEAFNWLTDLCRGGEE